MKILCFDEGSLITFWFRKWFKTDYFKRTDTSKLIHIIVAILQMYEVVSGHFYLRKWAGPTSENTFYSTKNFALSDRIGLKKNCVFEQSEGKH